jgi:hypothetical protein
MISARYLSGLSSQVAFQLPRHDIRKRLPRLKDRGVQDDTLVRLSDRAFRVYPFETRRAGESRLCPPRTVGVTGMVVTEEVHGLDAVGPREAVELCLRTPNQPQSTEAAKEKVAICNRWGETSIYQADRKHLSAALCACGNATGAAAALLAHCLNRRRIAQQIELPDGRVEARSHALPMGNGAWQVDQSWTGARLTVVLARLLQRDVAICTGAFNDYLVVRLTNRADLEAFDLPDALDLWNAAQSYGGFENPLRARLVAIAPAEAAPATKFYTCGRMHPGAPLTGLAILAMAASQVGWLASLLEPGRIEHRRGVDQLPGVRTNSKGTTIQFPAINVVLHGI